MDYYSQEKKTTVDVEL